MKIQLKGRPEEQAKRTGSLVDSLPGSHREIPCGTIVFLKRDCAVAADGATPILVAGEAAGLDLPYGCREGICHTCVGELVSGKVRDLRNGKVAGNTGEQIRTCINAPEGPVEIKL